MLFCLHVRTMEHMQHPFKHYRSGGSAEMPVNLQASAHFHCAHRRKRPTFSSSSHALPSVRSLSLPPCLASIFRNPLKFPSFPPPLMISSVLCKNIFLFHLTWVASVLWFRKDLIGLKPKQEARPTAIFSINCPESR